MAASGQGVESAAQERDRSVQNDHATNQEIATQTRGHVVSVLRSETPKAADIIDRTFMKGLLQVTIIFPSFTHGVNAAFR
jgi:hypothetical protein